MLFRSNCIADHAGYVLAMSVEVSVVIPVRDGADTIRRQLDALVAQLTPDVEIVVVDNGSTDTTAAVVESVAALHPAVRLESEPHGGANAARNHGIASSSGSLILLCDGDDEVAVNWIAAMRSVLETHELAGKIGRAHV